MNLRVCNSTQQSLDYFPSDHYQLGLRPDYVLKTTDIMFDNNRIEPDARGMKIIVTRNMRATDKERKYKPNDVCCFDASRVMLSFTGAKNKGPNNKIQAFIKESGKDTFTKQALLGIKYIDGQLRKGKAVMVGIDKGQIRTINETVTDHYIIIAGKYRDGDKWYYYYLDPGTTRADKGKSKEKNRLYINSNQVSKKIVDKDGVTTSYFLSQVRVNE